MVAGTASRLAMETDTDLGPWASSRRRAAAGTWSKGPLPASYRRQSPASSEASEAARARSSALHAAAETGTLDAGGGSCALKCVMESSTWLAGGGVGVRGFAGAVPLSCEPLFCRVMRLPGAAFPFSDFLSCWFAALFFPFATIDGGTAASGRSPRSDSTAAQDEPEWEGGRAAARRAIRGGLWEEDHDAAGIRRRVARQAIAGPVRQVRATSPPNHAMLPDKSQFSVCSEAH
jgi:hypothetical protein